MTRASRGVALITALLVVAIAALAATALLGSTRIAIQRTAALRDSEQAGWVARGVEAWVLGILDKDRRDSQRDGLDEDWARPVDYLPVDHGHVRGAVVDLEGRFNLNNLLDPARAPEYRAQFERLVAALPAELQAPRGLAAALADWADPDQNPTFPDGAEDSAYLGLAPPYRTADQPFTVVSELLAVRGVTPELYAALREMVSALPGTTTVNVNTAPEAVLRALSKSAPDEGKFRPFLERRAEQPVENRAEIFDRTGLAADAAPYVDVRSRHFQIQGEVFVGSSRVALYSLIRRPDAGPPTVLAHSADAE
jgi:general secretion pathway protein K